RRDLAVAHSLQAHLLEAKKQFKEAELAYGKCIQLFQELFKEFPTFLAYRKDLIVGQDALAGFLHRRGRSEDAVALFEGLVKQHPEMPEYRHHLAIHLSRHGVVLDRAGQIQAAEGVLRRSSALWKALCEEYPEEPAYRLGWAVDLS